MVVAMCKVDLFLLDEPNSLKRKRQIVKSLKERIRHRFGASIAEVDDQDLWQRATLGIAFVAEVQKDVEKVISKILGYIECDGTVEVVQKFIEYERI
jgi:uncharacterized protein YlxP (DUF503 family)